jgi:NarL family two-component system sensor histidine kinase YdfH
MVLYSLGVTRTQRTVPRVFICLGLLATIFLLSFFVRNSGILLGLYLALFVETFYLLGQTRLTVGFICISLLLLGLTLKTSHVGFGFGLDLIPPCLFVGGYVVLHAQQKALHNRTHGLLSELEQTHARLQTAYSQLAAYALQVEGLTRETERQRLARELHDTQSQGLVSLVLQLEAIKADLANQRYERASTLVEQAIGQARNTLTSARQAIDDLRANEVSPADLPEAIQEEIERFTSTTGIPCEADLAALTQLPPTLCEYTLRAIAEGLTNIARHAQAGRAWVLAEKHDEQMIIQVGDDGKGFDPKAAEQLIGHYGLLGLRERTLLLHGTCEITSAPQAGTTLRFSLPLGQGVNAK